MRFLLTQIDTNKSRCPQNHDMVLGTPFWVLVVFLVLVLQLSFLSRYRWLLRYSVGVTPTACLKEWEKACPSLKPILNAIDRMLRSVLHSSSLAHSMVWSIRYCFNEMPSFFRNTVERYLGWYPKCSARSLTFTR